MATVEQLFAREYPLQHVAFTFHNYMQGLIIGFLFVVWQVYHMLAHGDQLTWPIYTMFFCRITVYIISCPIRKLLFDKFVAIGHSSQGNLIELRDEYLAVFESIYFTISRRITYLIVIFDTVCFVLFFFKVHLIFWSITKFNILKQVLARMYLYYQFPWAQINTKRIWNMWNNMGYTTRDLDKVSEVFLAGDSDLHDEECCICMCKYEADDTVRKFWCKHHFHMNCVDEWMYEHRRCPYCQQEVSPDKEKED